MALIVNLHREGLLLINGAVLRFKDHAAVEIIGEARVLSGNRVMEAHEATTPIKQIYFALQTAYVGTEGQRPDALAQAKKLVEKFRGSNPPQGVYESLNQAMIMAESGDCYKALTQLRTLF